MNRTRPLLLAISAASLLPAQASAHLVTTGLGPVYDGISHLLLSPDDLIPVLAIAVLAGINGPLAGRRMLFVLSAAWLAGGLLAVRAGAPIVPAAILPVSFLGIGLLLAAGRGLSPATVAMIAAAVGLLHGWANGIGLLQARRESLALVGIVGAVFAAVAIVSGAAVGLRSARARLVVRVAGSWVAAIGLLMLGWSLRTAG